MVQDASVKVGILAERRRKHRRWDAEVAAAHLAWGTAG